MVKEILEISLVQKKVLFFFKAWEGTVGSKLLWGRKEGRIIYFQVGRGSGIA